MSLRLIDKGYGDGLLQYAEAMVRKYKRGGSEPCAARHLLIAAIALLGEYMAPGEVAVLAAEQVAELAQSKRRAASRIIDGDEAGPAA